MPEIENSKVEDKSNCHEITSMNELEKLLNAETKSNKKSSWNKLDKSTKLAKLYEFTREKQGDTDNDSLFETLRMALENNKLQKQKDVVYDTEREVVLSIPQLIVSNGTYVFKNERRLSTSRHLPHKKATNATKKNKSKIDDI